MQFTYRISVTLQKKKIIAKEFIATMYDYYSIQEKR